jgi:flagellar biosynthetic protein FliR
MQFEQLLPMVPVFVLVTFRVAGFMIFAPLFGSSRIPKRVRVLLAVIMAVGVTPTIAPPAHMPDSAAALAVGIGCEICFGFAMGMILSFVFIAAQWAGELIGQQMGFNLAETFDPQFGASSSLVGDLYYMLTLVVFLAMGGHRDMIQGLRDSFDHLPLLEAGVSQKLFGLIISLFTTSTMLALRLAAPVLVTMLIVDLTLGFLGKTMPQLNVLTAGLSIKTIVGLIVLLIGVTFHSTSEVIQTAFEDSLKTARLIWASPTAGQARG